MLAMLRRTLSAHAPPGLRVGLPRRFLTASEGRDADGLSALHNVTGSAGSVVLVVPFDKRGPWDASGARSTAAARAAAHLRAKEAQSLVEAAGWTVARTLIAPRDDHAAQGASRAAELGRGRAVRALPVGRGKLTDVAEAVLDTGATVVVVDTELAPASARAVRRLVKSDARRMAEGGEAAAAVDGLVVTDRHGVILDIFAQRARSMEARLQVELAAIERRRAHLRAGGSAELPSGPQTGGQHGSHGMAQQRGGFGFLGGSGERQIELDRRRLAARAAALRASLLKVERVRGVTQRGGAGPRAGPVTVALAGYTNAGKSHLAMALTGDASAFRPHDALFATLDSTMRRMQLPSGLDCRVVDTVGFIEGLPHALVASFRSTLADVADADVILHVRDPTHPRFREHARAVTTALGEVAPHGETGLCGRPVLEVWTKADLLQTEGDGAPAPPCPGDDPEAVQGDSDEAPAPWAEPEPDLASGTLVSSVTGQGLERLLCAIDEVVQRDRGVRSLSVALDPAAEPADADAQEWLFGGRQGVHVVDTRAAGDSAVLIKALVTPVALAAFRSSFAAQAARASVA